MNRPDPYGLWKLADDTLREWEINAFKILVELGVLDEGSLAPWYSLEDVIPMYPPRRPTLKPNEVYEDEAPPLAPLRSAMRARELILE